MLYKKIKEDSKLALSPTWSRSVAITIIIIGCLSFFLLSACLSYSVTSNVLIYSKPGFTKQYLVFLIIPITALISFSLLSPIFMGIKKYSQRIIEGGRANMKYIFYYYLNLRLSIKIFLLYLNIFFRKTLIYFFCLLPSIFHFFYIYSFFENNLSLALSNKTPNFYYFLGVNIFLFALGLTLARFLSSSYYVCSYIFLKNPHLPIKKIVKLSSLVTKKQKVSIMGFRLKQIPLKICGLLFIPILYIYPRILLSNGIFCNYLIEKYRKELNKSSLSL